MNDSVCQSERNSLYERDTVDVAPAMVGPRFQCYILSKELAMYRKSNPYLYKGCCKRQYLSHSLKCMVQGSLNVANSSMST